MSKKILVVGGTGMLGEPVARQLSADGYAVRVFSRSAARARERFPEPFEVAEGDVEDVAALQAAMQGCRAVHINLQGGGDWDLERRGAEAVAQAAAELDLARISLISGASTCQENSWFPMVRAKLAAEKAVCISGVPFTIFRCSMFMESLPMYVRDGKAMVMGHQPQPWRWVAAADYARMVSRSLSVEEARGKTFYIYGPEPLTMEQALEHYRELCAPEASMARVPFLVLSIVSLFPGRQELRRVGLPIMRYFSKVKEIGDAAEANALLGAPSTTLEEWCRSMQSA